jgi:hypothetical protein
VSREIRCGGTSSEQLVQNSSAFLGVFLLKGVIDERHVGRSQHAAIHVHGWADIEVLWFLAYFLDSGGGTSWESCCDDLDWSNKGGRDLWWRRHYELVLCEEYSAKIGSGEYVDL